MTTPRDARDGAQVPQEDAMNSRDEAVEQAVANAIAKARSESGRVLYPKNLPPKYIRDLVARFEEAVQEHDENGDTDTTEAVMRVRYTYLMEGLFAWGSALATPPAPDRTLAELVDAFEQAINGMHETLSEIDWHDMPQRDRPIYQAAYDRLQAARNALLAYQPPAPVKDVPFNAPGSISHGFVKPRRYFNVGDRVRLTAVQGMEMTEEYNGHVGEHGTVSEVNEDPLIGVRYKVAFDTFSWEDNLNPWFYADQLYRLPDQPPAPVSRAGAVSDEMYNRACEAYQAFDPEESINFAGMHAALTAALAAAEGRV